MRKRPINIFPNIKGIQIIIRGRPNKISRTKTIIFKIGIITKASFEKTNVTKSFAKANAQIGSFGIHIIMVK
jgi:ribosomal protein S3